MNQDEAMKIVDDGIARIEKKIEGFKAEIESVSAPVASDALELAARVLRVGNEWMRSRETLNESIDKAAALIERFAAERVRKAREEEREEFYERVLEWRGIQSKEDACPKCGGSGSIAYGSTATWMGGIGGQAITTDVCDECWGSGDKTHKWADLRKLRAAIKESGNGR